MIRPFQYGDQHRLKPNRFSDPSDVEHVFLNPNYEKYTLEDGGEIKCILCWIEYEPRKYGIFFLMPDGVEMRYAKQLKKFLDEATLRLKPELCMTVSVDCELLNKWHQFFGFVMEEGGRQQIKGVNFNKWVIKWAWKQH